MPLGRHKGEYDSNEEEMTPMQELNRTSSAVPHTLPPLSPTHPSSSPLFQQTSYGSQSTVTTSSSSEAADNKGLLSSGDEKKSSSSSDDERAEMGDHRRPIANGADSDSDDSSDGGNLKDEYGREVSPVAEVAAVVSNVDDPSLPCLTFRFWVMGLVSILSLSFVNQ
ncbi:hypothetical protein EC957_007375 [Mortierella hygrophila]|uniref:Uncharacterized protein n=1 Tax=Mortierella hygrophila TaxID=979708 RepID=A0A9P6EYS1_9FUNG|nr:hypothetical protein EC957_007375 [Mortierella hygrophila]